MRLELDWHDNFGGGSLGAEDVEGSRMDNVMV